MQEIIQLLNRRGLKIFITLNAPGFMPLTVETMGRDAFYDPLGRQTVSVAHYGALSGDSMRDPEMVFAVIQDSTGKVVDMEPVYFRNDYFGGELHVYKGGQKNKKLARSIEAFCRGWNESLRKGGFFKDSNGGNPKV